MRPPVESEDLEHTLQVGKVVAYLLLAQWVDDRRHGRHQILHYPTHPDRFTDRGGVLDFYGGSHRPLYPGRTMTKRDFSYQISDHLPLWIQINSDISRHRLQAMIGR